MNGDNKPIASFYASLGDYLRCRVDIRLDGIGGLVYSIGGVQVVLEDNHEIEFGGIFMCAEPASYALAMRVVESHGLSIPNA